MKFAFARWILAVAVALIWSSAAMAITIQLPSLAPPVFDYDFSMHGGNTGFVAGALTAPPQTVTLQPAQTSASATFGYAAVPGGEDASLSASLTDAATLYPSATATSDLFYRFEVVGTGSTQVPVTITFNDVTMSSTGGVDVTAAVSLYASTLNPDTQGFFPGDVQLVCGHTGPGYGAYDAIGTLGDCRYNAIPFPPISIMGAGKGCNDSLAACDGSGSTAGIPVSVAPVCGASPADGTLLASGSTSLSATNFNVTCDVTPGEIYTLGLSADLVGPYGSAANADGSVTIDPLITLGAGVNPTLYGLDFPGAPAELVVTSAPEPASLAILGAALALLAAARPVRRRPVNFDDERPIVIAS